MKEISAKDAIIIAERAIPCILNKGFQLSTVFPSKATIIQRGNREDIWSVLMVIDKLSRKAIDGPVLWAVIDTQSLNKCTEIGPSTDEFATVMLHGPPDIRVTLYYQWKIS